MFEFKSAAYLRQRCSVRDERSRRSPVTVMTQHAAVGPVVSLRVRRRRRAVAPQSQPPCGAAEEPQVLRICEGEK